MRTRQNAKWARFGPEILPAWVAEMDFSIAYPIRRAIDRLVGEQEFGYPFRAGGGHGDDGLAGAFARRMRARFGWEVDPALVQPLSDLVQGTFAAVWAFSEPGDGVLLHLPAYPPFHAAIHDTGRRLDAQQLRSDGSTYVLDLDEMRGIGDARTRILMLCNPQNPTGRVFTRDELLAMGQMAIARDWIIISDEIHSDLVYDGHAHIPIASLSPEIAARTVTITSATKGFNIPGLRCGAMHFGTAALRERFHARVPSRVLGAPGIVGIEATIAAWDQGQPWLDEVVPYLDANRQRLAAFLKAELPGIRFHAPEATYLCWLDCSDLGLPGKAADFFQERARVAFSPGEAFDPANDRAVRFNFATSAPILERILGRMAEAVRSNMR
ncbi:MAG: aminotransferase class I/II-fold pyridoxal phosphate-dependent enzyme [Acetobacteraceae bacterium]|nr:aminotransferase class I/II-fold pyridoxal phosphate-dependent enzyme [Acetobacteraceae bacterium]